MGWGRGGLLGEGSSVVGLGGNYVPWSSPGDLDVPWNVSCSSRAGVGGGLSRSVPRLPFLGSWASAGTP